MLLILELRDSRSHDLTGLKFDDFSLMICIIQNYPRVRSTLVFNMPSPLPPDRPQVKRPPPLLQIISNFLVFYGISHGTTLKKKSVAVF